MQNLFIAEECGRAGVSACLIETLVPETYSQAGEDLIVEALLAPVCAKAPPTPGLF
jgi:hypothetical protein